jgi:PHB accumulation regulatory protein
VPTLRDLVSFFHRQGWTAASQRVSCVHDPEIPVVLIEREAGQRLYDRDLRRYITVDDLFAWQLMSVPFIVRDAASGEDVTATIMLEPDRLH